MGHQVNTYWSWVDVQRADRYLAQLERMQSQNASGSEYVLTITSITVYLRYLSRAHFVMTELRKLGLVAHTQSYSFMHKNNVSSHPSKYDEAAHRAIAL
jgi:GPI-anchor transamidase subunit GAA1